MRKIFFLLLLFGFLWLLYGCIDIYIVLGHDTSLRGGLILYDRRGGVLSDIHKGGYGLPYTGSLETKLIKNIIKIEDRRFYEHDGIDIKGKLGALYENISAGSVVRGGSTITEQYIKNIYFPNEKRTWEQKIREALWATILEIRYTKEFILRKYLDSIYMGNGIYGISGASLSYFSSSGENLDDASILEIIARIHSPNLKIDDPYISRLSLRLFAREEPIVLESHDRVKNIDIFPLLTNRIEKEIDALCTGEKNKLIEFVREIPHDLCEKNTKILSTTIDSALSLFAEERMEGIIGNLEEKNIHNAALYIWSEKEKKVIAYIGNRRDAKDNAIDMIQEMRSVGSVLKPIIYKLAIEKGADGESYILDDTKVYETETQDKNYIPENYIPKSYGPIRLREALGNSLNSASVRLAEWLGIGKIYERFEQYGIDLHHDAGYYGYGIALGAPEVSLEDITHAYRYLANQNEKENFIIADILRDEKNRSRTFGVSSILNTSIPLSVKTGTSTDFRDNWAIGYDKNMILAVWVGNSDGTSMDDVSGVTGAGPLFHQVGEKLIQSGYIEPLSESIPEGIEETMLCLDTGCFQKEKVFLAKNHTIKSRPKSNVYSLGDFITPMTMEERKKWKIE